MTIISTVFATLLERFLARWHATSIATMVIAPLMMLANPVSAAVKVEGLSNALSVSAEAASVDDVLAALSARYHLVYETSPDFNRPIGGLYSGTLQQVLRRVLDGYSYVLELSAESISLRAWRESRVAAQSSQPPNPVAAATQLSLPPQMLGQGPFK